MKNEDKRKEGGRYRRASFLVKHLLLVWVGAVVVVGVL
jgi:hypothetical protein